MYCFSVGLVFFVLFRGNVFNNPWQSGKIVAALIETGEDGVETIPDDSTSKTECIPLNIFSSN